MWSFYAKYMKQITKNRKGKEEKKRKRVKGPGEPFWPSREKSPRPNLPPPEPVSSLSPPR
jgi:hypothetical protein